MKVIAWLAGVTTLVMAATYSIVSLNRWEWNRALFFGLIMLLAEVGLATGLVLRKLDRLLARPSTDPEVLRILRETRPPSADRFAWMRESANRTSVFITFLVGGGVLLSAFAWVVDRVAVNTATPRAEERLAGRLQSIGYPEGGLLVDDATVLAQDVPGDDDRPLRALLRGTRR